MLIFAKSIRMLTSRLRLYVVQVMVGEGGGSEMVSTCSQAKLSY